VETAVAEANWLATLFAYAPQILFAIPTVLLLTWSALTRDRAPAVLNIAVLVALSLTLLGFNIPIRSDHAAKGTHLRVMTYNIRQARNGVAGIVKTIAEQRPDVVCLQEVFEDQNARDPMPELRSRLPHGWYSVHAGELALFSRYPITRHEWHGSPAEPHAVLEACVRIRGSALTIFTIHMSLLSPRELIPFRRQRSLPACISATNRLRSGQAEFLVRLAGSVKGPVVIAGDLNTPPRGRIYSLIASRFADSFKSAGWGTGNTFPCGMPLWRIDHIFVGRAVIVRACWVTRSRASNHRPLVADLIWKGSPL